MSSTQRARLLVIDVDGTLLTTSYQLTATTRAAVQQVISRGVQVVLASARSPRALHAVMGELGITGLAICYTGALTCLIDPDPHVLAAVLDERRLSLSSAREVLGEARARGVSIGWFNADDWSIPAWDDALRRESLLTGVTPVVDPQLAQRSDAPHKLLAIAGDPALVPALACLARTLPHDCAGQFSLTNYLEVVHRGVDKAAALVGMAERLGIAPAEMVAIGDGENDMAMLRLVGCGIAMGNASPAVQSAATWVTESNDHGGVAAAVTRLRAEGWI